MATKTTTKKTQPKKVAAPEIENAVPAPATEETPKADEELKDEEPLVHVVDETPAVEEEVAPEEPTFTPGNNKKRPEKTIEKAPELAKEAEQPKETTSPNVATVLVPKGVYPNKVAVQKLF